MCMLRLTYIACLLALFSCNKDYHIPASVLDVYTSSDYCDSGCVAELWLVKHNDDAYYGTEYSGVTCPDMNLKDFYNTDGKPVQYPSYLYEQLATEGKYERILWRCSK